MFSRRLNFPGKIIDKCIENLKSYRERFSADTALASKFVSRILYLVALVYNLYFFFQADVLRRLFDIGFSYKHCNFTPACLPVKMASKTVIRPILSHLFQFIQLLSRWARFEVTVTLQEKQKIKQKLKNNNNNNNNTNEGYDRLSFKTN